MKEDFNFLLDILKPWGLISGGLIAILILFWGLLFLTLPFLGVQI